MQHDCLDSLELVELLVFNLRGNGLVNLVTTLLHLAILYLLIRFCQKEKGKKD